MTQLQARPTPEVWQERPLHPLAAAHVTRLDVAGVTATPAMRSALNILAWTIQAIGVAKFLAVWPFIGGTAAAHALDLMEAFDVTWNGTVTHSANGVAGDGSTGYGVTALLSSSLPESNSHLSAYMGSSAPGGSQVTMGALETSDRYNAVGWLSGGTKESGGIACKVTEFAPAATAASRPGYFCAAAGVTKANQFYEAGVAVGAPVTGTSTQHARPIYLLAINSVGTAAVFCSRSVRLLTAGLGLTAAEVATLNKGVQRAQQILGRAV